jgi:hypothetical protein
VKRVETATSSVYADMLAYAFIAHDDENGLTQQQSDGCVKHVNCHTSQLPYNVYNSLEAVEIGVCTAAYIAYWYIPYLAYDVPHVCICCASRVCSTQCVGRHTSRDTVLQLHSIGQAHPPADSDWMGVCHISYDCVLLSADASDEHFEGSGYAAALQCSSCPAPGSLRLYHMFARMYI